MKIAVFASLIAGASAFVPSAKPASSSTTALNAAKFVKKPNPFASELGVISPTGFFGESIYLSISISFVQALLLRQCVCVCVCLFVRFT
jgi:hypothetical protein